VTTLIGINHVALEVNDVDAALAWYGRWFRFELRGRLGQRAAFIDMGDQFLALMAGDGGGVDAERHFGLVVDDKEAVRSALLAAGVPVAAAGSVDFHDPWGNSIQIVDYREIQFTKTAGVLRALGLDHVEKTEAARAELAEKGIAD
jgi:catechol 2,3-dioxygenase-like lactoylglutathione lyase family enzyme